MKPTGASASTFFVSVLRPMRCCSRAKRRDAGSSFQTRISPSSTVPSAAPRASATISGKRSVTSSSPRDQIQTCRARLTTCAADAVVLPLDDPVLPARRAGSRTRSSGASSWWARKNGYGWPTSSGPTLARSRSAQRSAPALGVDPAVGVAHHALRDALGVDARVLGERALHQQLADADAKAAADQLGQQEAARRVELVPVARRRARACSSAAGRAAAAAAPRPTRPGRGRSSCAGGGSTCAMVSARSPTAW